ncbi:MAG: acyl-CoA dehydrogenase family protein [Acidobacteria bacterium]|nr:acyl-CoA dehydrogenase family protein [Acidobacteriota bacterium]
MPTSLKPNFYTADYRFQARLRRLLPADVFEWAEPKLIELGDLAANFFDPRAAIADRYGPILRCYDREGNRIDEVQYHPAYLEMARAAYGFGLVSLKYDAALAQRFGSVPYAVIFGLGYLLAQAEAGLFCPVCMTDGAARVLVKFADPKLQAEWLPRLTTRDFDLLAQGAMFLTEKQGGSDVGTNTTRAIQEGDHWRLYGDKWFCSNVDAEAVLALARPDGAPGGTKGLGLFLVSKTLPDGRPNHYRINRLKDKLGVRSMATGEVTFEGAEACVVGDVRKGFAYMTEMINLSRLYNSVAAVSSMRRAVYEAVKHAQTRPAFGSSIVNFPLMQRVLADLIVEHEAAMALVFEAIHQLDLIDSGTGGEDAVRQHRLLLPLAKYYTGRLAVWAASEAMEVLGGNGYIEEFVTARLLRDAQVLPIWEGTTNILVLDAQRAMIKEEAHTSLIHANTRRLESLHEPALQDLRAAIENRFSALVPKLLSVQRGEAEAIFSAKEATDELVRLTQASLLLSEAQHDKGLLPLARYFIEKHRRGTLNPQAAAEIIAKEAISIQPSAVSQGKG